MSPTQIVVLVVLVVVALTAAAWMFTRRRALQSRFGPEYDRLVAEQDSRAAAERELRDRERRHAGLTLTPLSAESRADYAREWQEAVVHYHALFADLLGEEPVRHHPDEPRPDAPQHVTSR